MDIEQLGRLAPTTCRFDIGRGGIPPLQSIDYAGALAWTDAQVGAALLQLSVLGFDQPGALEQVGALIGALVAREQDRRTDDRFAAEYSAIMGDSNAVSDLRSMRSSRWPTKPGRIERITAMVVLETVDPGQCWTCNGNGPKTSLGRRLIRGRALRKGTTAGELAALLVKADHPDSKKVDLLLARKKAEIAACLAGMAKAGVLDVMPGHRDPSVIWYRARCKSCRGTGRRELTDAKRAEWMGLSFRGWLGAQPEQNFLGWLRATVSRAIDEARADWSTALD